MLEERWRWWLHAVAVGEVEFLRAQTERADFSEAFAGSTAEPPPPGLSEAGEDVVERIKRAPELERTPARRLLEQLKKASSIVEHDEVEAWYDRCYNRAIAAQYGADFVALSGPRESGRQLGSEGANLGVLTYSFPDDVRHELHAMPPAAYDVLWHEVRLARENLWEKRTRRARYRLAFELQSSFERETRTSVIVDTTSRMLLGISAGLAGWAIGGLHSAWIAILATVGVAIAALMPDGRLLYKALVETPRIIRLRVPSV